MKALPSKRVRSTRGIVSFSTRMQALCMGAVSADRQELILKGAWGVNVPGLVEFAPPKLSKSDQ